jgi:CDP-4-dehydro-6-deoxyglucose reductase
MSLYWGGRTPVDLYLDLSAEVPRLDLHYHPVLSRGDAAWGGRRGYVQQVMLADAPDLSRSVVHACGSPAMIDGSRVALLAAGLPARRFLVDAFVSSGTA